MELVFENELFASLDCEFAELDAMESANVLLFADEDDVAMEGVKENAVKLWHTFVDGCKRFFNWVGQKLMELGTTVKTFFSKIPLGFKNKKIKVTKNEMSFFKKVANIAKAVHEKFRRGKSSSTALVVQESAYEQHQYERDLEFIRNKVNIDQNLDAIDALFKELSDDDPSKESGEGNSNSKDNNRTIEVEYQEFINRVNESTREAAEMIKETREKQKTAEKFVDVEFREVDPEDTKTTKKTHSVFSRIMGGFKAVMSYIGRLIMTPIRAAMKIINRNKSMAEAGAK